MAISQITGLPGGVGLGGNSAGISVLPGLAAYGILRVAANGADNETVTIGADVYRLSVVNTAFTPTPSNGQLNNTSPYVQNVELAAHGLVIGDLLKSAANEIMQVTGVPSVNRVHLRRGVSGSTIGAIANGATLTKEAAAAGGAGIHVGFAAAPTPTQLTAALTADINSRGINKILALNPNANELIIALADKVGGSTISGVSALATTETLAGGGNAWDAATLGGGLDPAEFMLVKRVPTAAEFTAGLLHIILPFAPTVVETLVRTTSTGAAVVWDGAVTISGHRVTLDNSGGVDWAATSTILLFIRGSAA